MSTSENDDKTPAQTFYETLDACGGTVFPVRQGFEDGSFTYFAGLTVRDWFAGQALAGWLSSFPRDSTHPASRGPWASELALNSYRLADAMLAERAKSEGEQP